MAENETTLEQVRRQVNTLGFAIEKVDEMNAKVVEMRWQYEMLRRDPALGQQARGTVTPDKHLTTLRDMERQRDNAETVAMYLAGTPGINEAREAYMDLLTAFQRVGLLKQIGYQISNGFAEALEQGRKELALPATAEEDTVLDAYAAAITDAITNLACVVNEHPLPEISTVDLVKPTGSLVLR